ncbi:hypothetical protein N9740_06625 [Pseudomonadales bacterium]|nr:hypothetical protein [Pseudomonadales bacterium]
MPINRSTLWFTLFVLTIPFDLLNGFLVYNIPNSPFLIISPSQLIRLVGVLLILYFSYSNWITYSISLVLLTIFIFSEYAAFLIHQNEKALISGLTSVPNLLAIYLAINIKLKKEDFYLIASYSIAGALLIAILLCFSQIFSLGQSTYGSGGFGTKFYFASGNGVGLYLGISALLINMLSAKRIISTPVYTIPLLVFGLLMLASKAALVLALINILIFALRYKASRILIPVIAASIFIFLDQIVPLFRILLEISIRRFEAADGDMLRFLFSGRYEELLFHAEHFLHEHPIQRIFFGGGYFFGPRTFTSVGRVDILEADIFDIFFIYGALGLAFYTFVWVSIFRSASLITGFWLVAILMFAHSAFLGHVFFNGMFIQLVFLFKILRVCKAL